MASHSNNSSDATSESPSLNASNTSNTQSADAPIAPEKQEIDPPKVEAPRSQESTPLSNSAAESVAPPPASVVDIAKQYRPDIDGLRAVAVLAVVAFHADATLLPGGFTGVDVFFVISGYLISRILFHENDTGTYSIAQFYVRRVKRIFPALAVVLIAVLLAGKFALLAEEYQSLGWHTAAGAGFVANLAYWKEAGYFDAEGIHKPLLHLWSLGVEEQFYIVWPVLLWALWKWLPRKAVLPVVGVLLVASFGYGEYNLAQDDVGTFFAPYTRFWELLVGVLLAGFERIYTVRSKPVYHALSVIGTVLIILGIALFDQTSPFPGWRAVLPVVGTGLVIAAGPQAIVNRWVLSLRPMIWVGLISYPLYLWHWPLLSFARIVEMEEPSSTIRAGAVALAFVFTILTYFLVETPIRHLKKTLAVRIAIASLVSVVAATGAVGYYIDSKEGLPARFPEIAAAQENLVKKLPSTPGCAKKYGAPSDGYCHVEDPKKPPTALLIGDSFATAIFPGLSDVFEKNGQRLLHLGKSGCPPFFNVDRFGGGHSSRCPAYVTTPVRTALKNKSIETVVIVGRYPSYVAGDGYAVDAGRKAGALHIQAPGKLGKIDKKKYPAVFENALNTTITELVESGKKVIFVHSVPELDFRPSTCVDSRPVRLTNHVKTPCSIERKLVTERQKTYRRIVKKVLDKFPEVQVVDPTDVLCTAKACFAMDGKSVLYRDNSHLSVDGSFFVANKLPFFKDREVETP